MVEFQFQAHLFVMLMVALVTLAVVFDVKMKQLLQQKMVAQLDLNRPGPVSRRDAAQFIADQGEVQLIPLARILLLPPAGVDPVQIALERIQELRAQIVGGEIDFAAAAEAHSQDTGSAVSGGDLGTFERGTMVAEFDAVVFNQAVGEISEPVRPQYGWHLIKVEERQGEQARARHILIRPNVEGSATTALAGAVADLRARLDAGEVFLDVASVSSQADGASERRGYWRVVVATDQSTLQNIPETWFATLQTLEPGGWDGPLEGEDGVSLVYRMPLDRETTDLVLQYDFPTIEVAVRNLRRSEAIQAWLAEIRSETYIEIKKD